MVRDFPASIVCVLAALLLMSSVLNNTSISLYKVNGQNWVVI